MPTTSAAAACLLAVASLTVGCGGDADQRATTAPTTAPPAAVTAPTVPSTAPETTTDAPTGATAPTGAARPEVRERRRRLERAGFDRVDASGTAGDPALDGALELPLEGGGALTVYVYRSEREAERKAGELRPLAERHPEQARVARRGATVYFGAADVPERLDTDAFDRAVAAAETP